MEQSTPYREFADECDRLAKKAKTEHHRKILEELAEVWKQLAKECGGEQSRET
jgi:hypothetical protein